MKTRYIVITDTHLMEKSGVRTGDIKQDLADKLKFCVDYANNVSGTLLIAGDIFDSAVVSEEVKSFFAPILLEATNRPFVIRGNHDIMYNSIDRTEKTSLNVWISHGVVRLLDQIEYEDHTLTSRTELEANGKPKIVIRHGFLNKEDGRNTVRIEELFCGDVVLAILGHDHEVYPPVEMGNTTVLRPGSFIRAIRNDGQYRTPQLVDIEIEDGEVSYEMVDIPCRSDELIFKTKKETFVFENTSRSYDDIIREIKVSSAAKDMTLQEALSKVSDPQTVAFVMDRLNEVLVMEQNK